MNYTFYYDESNNIRTLYLTHGKFNTDSHENPSPCFVLAGIAHNSKQAADNCKELIASLHLPSTAKELKFKQVAKGGFLDNLKSAKINQILSWLIDSNYYLHYMNLNMEYWSLVDIIDDCCNHVDHHGMIDYTLANGRRSYIDYHKDAIYYIMNKYRSEFLGVLTKYRYPNVAPKNSAAFINKLNKIINKNRQPSARLNDKVSKVDLSRTNSLFKLFKMCKKIESLKMVYQNEPFKLIDGLSIFYHHCIELFSTSSHVFDNEFKIEENLKKSALLNNASNSNNFKFVESKEYPAIQVSDVLSGLLKNYFTFIAKTSVPELVEAKKNLTEQQQQCVKLLKRLIEKSDTEQSEFLYYIMSQIEHHKHAVFLFDKDAKNEFVQVVG